MPCFKFGFNAALLYTCKEFELVDKQKWLQKMIMYTLQKCHYGPFGLQQCLLQWRLHMPLLYRHYRPNIYIYIFFKKAIATFQNATIDQFFYFLKMLQQRFRAPLQGGPIVAFVKHHYRLTLQWHSANPTTAKSHQQIKKFLMTKI